MFEFIKAVSDTVFDMINAVYHDKPLIFIRAMFREKLISHHQAVSEPDVIAIAKNLQVVSRSPVQSIFCIYWEVGIQHTLCETLSLFKLSSIYVLSLSVMLGSKLGESTAMTNQLIDHNIPNEP